MDRIAPAEANVRLDADLFLRTMLRELTGLLQDVVGMEDAQGYISSVGAAMGRWIEQAYREEMGGVDLDPRQIAEVFVDLKRRIGGDFYIVSADASRIVVGNRRCPFGRMAEGHDALCMMTSNVFGRIAADHTGYARVTLHRTIARRDKECLVEIRLDRSEGGDAGSREYYRVDGQ